MLSHRYVKGLIYRSSIINSQTTYFPLTYAVTTWKPTMLKLLSKIPTIYHGLYDQENVKRYFKISYNICKASNANMGKKVKVSWQLTPFTVLYIMRGRRPSNCHCFPLTDHFLPWHPQLPLLCISPSTTNNKPKNAWLVARPSWESRSICNLIAVIGEGDVQCQKQYSLAILSCLCRVLRSSLNSSDLNSKLSFNAFEFKTFSDFRDCSMHLMLENVQCIILCSIQYYLIP